MNLAEKEEKIENKNNKKDLQRYFNPNTCAKTNNLLSCFCFVSILLIFYYDYYSYFMTSMQPTFIIFSLHFESYYYSGNL